jgi:hypothetical protein
VPKNPYRQKTPTAIFGFGCQKPQQKPAKKPVKLRQKTDKSPKIPPKIYC